MAVQKNLKRRLEPPLRDHDGAVEDFYKNGNADDEMFDTSGHATRDNAQVPKYEAGAEEQATGEYKYKAKPLENHFTPKK